MFENKKEELEAESQKFKEKVLRQRRAIDQAKILKKFVDENLSDLKTKKDKIIFLGEMFEGMNARYPYPHSAPFGGVSRWAIAEAVECDHSYVKQILRVLEERIEAHPGREHISLQTRRDVLERDNRRCVRCGAEDDLVFHHIRPYSWRDPEEANNPENLAVLCKKCHHDAHLPSSDSELAYRVAGVPYTRASFQKWIFRSMPGMNRIRARSLYKAGYRTRQDIKKASVDELAKVPRIGLATAKKIKDYCS